KATNSRDNRACLYMPQSFFAYIPLSLFAAILIVIGLLIGSKSGVANPTLAIWGLAALSGWLAFVVVMLGRRMRQGERHSRQVRLVAERWQAMLQSAPGGYCLFTLQGLLRETARATAVLGIEHIAHIEDIVTALRDGTDFI